METVTYIVKDNRIFPNSILPVILYKDAIDVPFFRPAHAMEKLFEENGWTNNWHNGLATYHHYHSNTHEVIGVYKGKMIILLGGENGKHVVMRKGDVIIIPAGVAHKNLGKEEDALCVGGYPEGIEFDMNLGEAGERPAADRNISAVNLPQTDPVLGHGEGLVELWKQAMDRVPQKIT